MKLKILLLLFITLKSYSQVSVGPKHTGKSKKFKKGVLAKFKNTETIFLLSNVYDKNEYEKILKDSWNVTSYKIVDFEGFDIENYLSNKYSIAQLDVLKKIEQVNTEGEILDYILILILKYMIVIKYLKNSINYHLKKERKTKNILYIRTHRT
jgi:hypothetical protein